MANIVLSSKTVEAKLIVKSLFQIEKRKIGLRNVNPQKQASQLIRDKNNFKIGKVEVVP